MAELEDSPLSGQNLVSLVRRNANRLSEEQEDVQLFSYEMIKLIDDHLPRFSSESARTIVLALMLDVAIKVVKAPTEKGIALTRYRNLLAAIPERVTPMR